MTINGSSPPDPADLRSRAEELLRKKSDALDAIPPEEIGRLLHELQVYQVELEMQNNELRRAEQELEASRVKYFDLYDMAPVGYFNVSEKGLILEANLRAAEMLGVERNRLVNQPLTGYIHPEDQDSYYLHWNRLLETDARQVFELRMCRQDGSRFWARLETGAARVGEDGPLVCRTTVSDITEQKRAEEEKRGLEMKVLQAQKMESLGVLAGGIAHDFNNILMAVLGHAELALDELSPMSPARGSLAEITTAARRAADLCRQMLAYAGKSSFALERVGLRELVEEMAHLLKTAISKKAILNLNLERGLPPIQADPSQIRQVVMNLMINASEAIGERSGVITVSVGATRCDEEYLRKTELRDDLAPGLYVHLEVTDTGSGMEAETRARIFDPFFSTKFTGRGLGLAAVLGIVRAHKGALKVYSELGKGTTFKILFPAMEETGKEARTDDSSPLADWRGTGTILLVDDEESLIALGARMLEHLGFTVLTAADGLQAVDVYRERGKEIDLVLMDLTMPHMDGAEAFGELRRLNPDVRVVLASGYSHEDVASRFAGKGLSGVLQKPYTLLKMREALARLLPSGSYGEA
ncbi:MAG: hybrid sensor histidine kinase/response regulator [Candidatus Deferrimicrobiaceae bacterium]